MFDRWQTGLRERRLAGDNRAGEWVRSGARDLHWAFIRREWRFLAGTVAAVALLTAVVVYFTHSVFLRGLIGGAASVGTFAALAVLVMMLTGTANRSMGAVAETWTASELRPLRNTAGVWSTTSRCIGGTSTMCSSSRLVSSPWKRNGPPTAGSSTHLRTEGCRPTPSQPS